LREATTRTCYVSTKHELLPAPARHVVVHIWSVVALRLVRVASALMPLSPCAADKTLCCCFVCGMHACTRHANMYGACMHHNEHSPCTRNWHDMISLLNTHVCKLTRPLEVSSMYLVVLYRHTPPPDEVK
jgi:hypothetical protein